MTTRQHKQNDKKQEALNGFKADINELRPEMPRLEEYFAGKENGVHPFDKITPGGPLEDQGLANDEEIKAEVEREKQLYERELLGRLMGQRLTPQQYEVLAGLDADQQMRMKRQLDTNNEEFLAQRHQARLIEETAEKIRRRKVL